VLYVVDIECTEQSTLDRFPQIAYDIKLQLIKMSDKIWCETHDVSAVDITSISKWPISYLSLTL